MLLIFKQHFIDCLVYQFSINTCFFKKNEKSELFISSLTRKNLICWAIVVLSAKKCTQLFSVRSVLFNGPQGHWRLNHCIIGCLKRSKYYAKFAKNKKIALNLLIVLRNINFYAFYVFCCGWSKLKWMFDFFSLSHLFFSVFICIEQDLHVRHISFFQFSFFAG